MVETKRSTLQRIKRLLTIRTANEHLFLVCINPWWEATAGE